MPPGTGTGFQSFVNLQLPVAVAGDFAGANIKASLVSGPWQFVTSPAGVLVGSIGWANPATGLITSYYEPDAFAVFIHRESQGVITAYLGIATMQCLNGQRVIGYDQGEFWGLFTAGATIGQKVYANPVTGALTASTTGNSISGANTAASITGGVLTTTDADQSGGALAVGQIITGAGIPGGTYIASAAGTGSGTHLWNLANVDGTAIGNETSEAIANYGATETQFAMAENITAADCDFTGSLAVPAAGTAFGILTVSAIASGTLVPGQWLSATGLPGSANTQILQQLTGAAGSTGTYLTTNTNYTITSTNTLVATQGKLAKISTWGTWT